LDEANRIARRLRLPPTPALPHKGGGRTARAAALRFPSTQSPWTSIGRDRANAGFDPIKHNLACLAGRIARHPREGRAAE